MKLVGIEIQNFRSIGNDPIILSPWKQCNILIGQNNTGKSNVIKAVQKIVELVKPGGQKPKSFENTDYHLRNLSNRFTFTLKFQYDPKQNIDRIITDKLKTDKFDFTFSWENKSDWIIIDNSFTQIQDFGQAKDFIESISLFYDKSSEIAENFLRNGEEIFKRFFAQFISQVYIIPEFRQIETGDEYSLSGKNLVRLLASYQHPEIGNDTDQAKFNKIQELVRQLLHMPEAMLEVTNDKTSIVISNHGLRLPLSSYGTGVHQLVILVTAILSIDNAICCIEEPEIHLHPTLQREFLEFITTQTTNTFLISTHSPTLINSQSRILAEPSPKIQIFHLRKENGVTIGGPVLKDTHSLDALSDLGVRATDILQSNSIIWVEGPSDRIYLNRWLQLIAPELVEGVHYSIMFYGGRLLSHLSTERDEVTDELIDMLKINQHPVVMIDSDRKHAEDTVNTSKQRISDECNTSECICWITHGREIENYIASRVVTAACQELFGVPVQFEEKPFEKFDDALDQALKNAGFEKGCKYGADKVKFAKVFAEHFELEDMSSQLKERVSGVVDKIRSWNK